MFAIIETGGKQYRVGEGETLSIEKLAEKKVGDTVVFDKVLLLDDGATTKIGAPYLDGVTIEATVTAEGKGKKIHIQKFKSKSRYKRRVGHRQPFVKVAVAELQ